MFICNCNGLTKNDINIAITKGACCTQAVYRILDCEPKCGKCACDIKKIINQQTSYVKKDKP